MLLCHSIRILSLVHHSLVIRPKLALLTISYHLLLSIHIHLLKTLVLTIDNIGISVLYERFVAILGLKLCTLAVKFLFTQLFV